MSDEEEYAPPAAPKRSKRSIMLELTLWALLSIAIAVSMVILSERFLPTNF